MDRETLKLETTRERKFVEYVEGQDYDALKLTKRGYPDRLILLDHGYSFQIEFKRDTKNFTKRKGEKLQQYIHSKLRDRGIHVYLCDNVEQAITIFHHELTISQALGTLVRGAVAYEV